MTEDTKTPRSPVSPKNTDGLLSVGENNNVFE